MCIACPVGLTDRPMARLGLDTTRPGPVWRVADSIKGKSDLSLPAVHSLALRQPLLTKTDLSPVPIPMPMPDTDRPARVPCSRPRAERSEKKCNGEATARGDPLLHRVFRHFIGRAWCLSATFLTGYRTRQMVPTYFFSVSRSAR